MRRQQLKDCTQKYARFEVRQSNTKYINPDFEELLAFIGENVNLGKPRALSNAYLAIRQTTDMLLKARWQNWNLKTSKKEISSIRMCFLAVRNYSVERSRLMIPFKVEYIFQAIILLVAMIRKDFGVAIPVSLHPLINSLYKASFYKFHIDTYNSALPRIRSAIIRSGATITTDEQCLLDLEDDFIRADSWFRVEFGAEIGYWKKEVRELLKI